MSFSRVKTVDVERLLCALYQSYFNIFLPVMAYRWIFIPWWPLVFPIREFQKCQGRRGWKPSWNGWFRITESKGQKRFYSFLRPVMLWSLNLHLWRFDKWSSDAIEIWWPLFGQSWLKIWLKVIFLKPLLDVQVHPYRDSEQLNFWPPSLFFWFGFLRCFSYMNSFFLVVFLRLLNSKADTENDICMTPWGEPKVN